MKISAMDYSFSRGISVEKLDTPGIIRYLKALEVPGVEFMEAFVDEGDLDNMRSALSETGTDVVAFLTYCNFIDPDPAERQARVGQLRQSLRLAAALGAPHVTVVPGMLEGDISPKAARDWISQGLRECLSDASDLGITLAIENLGLQTAVYGRSEYMISICEAVGSGLKLTYDAGNFLLAAENSIDALNRIASRVVHVHFKDWQVVELQGEAPDYVLPGSDGRHYEGAVLGEGLVDLPAAAVRLNQLGYDGYISVEYEGIGDEPKEAVRRGAEYLRSLLEASSD